jgi:PAS domain S-box-containing protein
LILRLTLRQHILATLLTLLVGLALTVTLLLQGKLAAEFRERLQKRGVLIANHLARNSVAPVLARDGLALSVKAHEELKTEDELAYVLFLSADGEVLGHSFGATFPLDLQGVNRVEPGQALSTRLLKTEQGAIQDIAVPIPGGLGSVRVGMSLTQIDAVVNQLTWEVLLTTLTLLVLGVALAFPLSSAMARPVRRMTRAAEAMAGGDLNQQVAAQGPTELWQLAAAFNTMTQNLRQARNDLERQNRSLQEQVQRREIAENLLASQLSILSTLLNEIPCPVYFKDRHGAYLGCNRAFEEFIARPKAEVIGKQAADLLSQEQAAWHRQVDEELLQHPGLRIYEGTVLRGDGRRRQIVFNKATFQDETGELAGIVGVMLDVTAERENDRLRAEFVSTVAHEFQTPLTAILGFAELLKEDPRMPSGELREYLDIIQDKGEYLSRLVDQLLDVSRLECGRELPLHKAPCRLDQLLRTLVRSYQQRSAQDLFELLLPADCPTVPADEVRLTQVLENLLSNAVKYSPAGARVRVGLSFDGESARVEVTDRGRGMSAEELARAFDKFYRSDTTDTAPAGTGLGLFIARSIVEAHGGSIEAESRPGQGTTLSFTLPLA